MPVTLNRTGVTPTDDDLTGTVGTAIDAAWATLLMDRIDVGFAALLPLAGGTLTGVLTVNGQITFPAAQNASANANTLDDYEEGTWTPSDQSGAGLSFTSVSGSYVKIGQLVVATAKLTYPSTGDTSNSVIGGLPFTSASAGEFSSTIGGPTSESTLVRIAVGVTSTNTLPYTAAGARITNATLTLDTVVFTAIYRASA